MYTLLFFLKPHETCYLVTIWPQDKSSNLVAKDSTEELSWTAFNSLLDVLYTFKSHNIVSINKAMELTILYFVNLCADFGSTVDLKQHWVLFFIAATLLVRGVANTFG